MKRAFVFVAYCLMLLFVLSGLGLTSSPKARRLTIKVTSSDPTEKISFEAAYIFKKDAANLIVLKQTTPVTIEETAEYLSAIFHKVGGKANLQVELLSATDSTATASDAAWGDIIVLGTHSGKNGVGYFAQSY